MKIKAEPFCVPKRGNSEDENDDAVWPDTSSEYQKPIVRFAVADGATESIFAGRWAKQLVVAVGENRLSLGNKFPEIQSLRSKWHEWMGEVKLAWYAEEKARQGTYAALIGLEISASGPGQESDRQWQATALGDACFFHIRGDEIKKRFPVETSDKFDNRPFLLGTRAGDDEALSEKVVQCQGSWIEGDEFYLMTDALACWFLRQIELDNKPLEALRANASSTEPTRFPTWIESLRDKGLIRNDDSTLLRIIV